MWHTFVVWLGRAEREGEMRDRGGKERGEKEEEEKGVTKEGKRRR